MTHTKIKLVAPEGACAGESLAITVVIETPSAIDFERIEIWLRGTEAASVSGGGRLQIASSACFLDETVTVAERGTLPAGRHELHATFRLPSNSPPTHDTTPAYASLRGRGRIVRAFPAEDVGCVKWFDVRRISTGPIEREPSVVQGDKLSVSVASRRLAIGESIVGWISTEIAHTKPLEVVLQLVAMTEVIGPERGSERFAWRRTTVFVPAADQPVPFELALPTSMPPTFVSLSHARDWVLVVRTPGRLWRRGHSVEVFLEVFDVVGAQAPEPVVAPEIGRKQIGPVFAEFASANDWQLHELLEHDDQLGMLRPAVGRIDGQLVFELACAYGADGMLVTARAEYPSLALGLVVEPSSPLRELLTHDIDAEHPAWDRTHHVEATEEAAAAVLLHAVVPELVAATSLGELLRWTDTAIVFTRGAAWIEADELARMAAELDKVAHAITATVATPPQPYR